MSSRSAKSERKIVPQPFMYPILHQYFIANKKLTIKWLIVKNKTGCLKNANLLYTFFKHPVLWWIYTNFFLTLAVSTFPCYSTFIAIQISFLWNSFSEYQSFMSRQFASYFRKVLWKPFYFFIIKGEYDMGKNTRKIHHTKRVFVQKKYRDALFRKIFSERSVLLELYNALNNTG